MKRRAFKNISGRVGLLICLAAVMSITCGCGSKPASSDKKDKDKAAGKTSAAAEKADSEAEDKKTDDDSVAAEDESQAQAVPFEAGEKLAKTAELFDGDYTYSVRSSFSDDPTAQTTVVITKSGSEVHIAYTDGVDESTDGDKADEDKDSKDKKDKKDKDKKDPEDGNAPSRAYFFDGSTAYDIDLGMGIYNTREKWEDYNLILSLIDSEPEITEAHMPDEMAEKGYSVEEYTYPGDTYITVFDFYFDKDDNLKQYMVTYKVEGDDDLVQTCVVERLEAEAKPDEDALEGLTDFSALDEEQRSELCLEICTQRGITSEKMSEAGIAAEELGKMDYEAFTELVYTYGDRR